MFTVTNLVDRNLGDNLQVINLDDMTITKMLRNDNDYEQSNLLNGQSNSLNGQSNDHDQISDLKKIYLVEPQRGRIFLAGDAIVPGMSFKNVVSGPSGPISEIICPYGKSISYYYSICKRTT